MLPINEKQNLTHIYSKIGLSKTLFNHNIATPHFIIANNISEAVLGAETIGYPVMLKIDSSNGGSGVFEINSEAEFNLLDSTIFDHSVLIQKKIEGKETDLSALYRDGKLLHFNYAILQKVITNKFGPSSVRVYQQLSQLDEQTFLDLDKLGKALGANGFVNISSIVTKDNKRYFIEADMRPNVWVDFTKFIGDDLAYKVSQWFLRGTTLQYPYPVNHNYPKKLLLAYYLRLSFLEILFNRYNVWKHIPWEDKKLAWELIYCRKIRIFLRQIKRIPTNLIRLFIPQKEKRLRIKNLFKKLVLRNSY